MTPRRFDAVLLFSLIGLTMWFFGNLYEAVVIAPNLLVDVSAKVHAWQAFFTVTNPVWFYIPFAPLATFTTVGLYVVVRGTSSVTRKRLRVAALASGLALLLGAYIVVHVNLPLFFGHPPDDPGALRSLAISWNLLNGLRVVLVALAVISVFVAYVSEGLARPQERSGWA